MNIEDKIVDDLISRVRCALQELATFEHKIKMGALHGDALREDSFRAQSNFRRVLSDVQEMKARVDSGEVECDDKMRFVCFSVKDLKRGMRRVGIAF